jgi:polyhydroxyalkanoate synthesis regulator phasin
MLYAVGAIIPYFSQISHLVKATHIVTVFNKTGKVVGVASRSDRKLLKTLVNSLENTSPEAKSFVVRLFNHSKRSPEELERIAKRYTEIQSKMKHVIGVKFKVTVMRGVNPEHLPVGASSADRTSEIFQKRVSEMDHRFTLSGDEDTYATVVERTIKETEEIINLETGRLKNKYAIKNLQIENALDLTKPGTLEQLGLSEDLVRTSIEVSSQAYEITQQIGDLARKLGFDAVIFHSAEVTGAKNIVIFNK